MRFIIRNILSTVTGILLHSYIFYRMFFKTYPQTNPTLFFLYITGSFLIAYGLSGDKTYRFYKSSYFWLYFILCVLFPLYGSIGIIIIVIFKLIFPEHKTREGDIESTYSFARFLDSKSISSEYDSDVKKIIQQELQAQSYFDIIKSSNRYLKKNLIRKIIKGWTPNGVLLLKEAINDPDYDIRSYAANALNSVEEQLTRNLLNLKKRLRTDPQNISLKLKLARAHFFFINTGIIDTTLEKFYIDIISTLLEEIHSAIKPGDEFYFDFLLLKADVYRLKNETSEEKSTYMKILEYKPDHLTALARLCEILFSEKDFPALHKWSKGLIEHVTQDNPYSYAAGLVLGKSETGMAL